MPAATQQDAEAFLAKRPSLKEMREAYPAEWEQVQAEIAKVVNTGDLDQLKRYVEKVSTQRGAGDVKKAMAVEALRKVCVSAATGVTRGKVRFNLFNGWLAQKLLFEGKGLKRKPVSLARFAVTWPFLTQKRFLMPLVEPKGIYCFYSRKLIKELAKETGDRKALEIAAGDGTLSRFLQQEGIDIVATDDHSWSHAIDFPDDVENQDAVTALKTREPQVVICSWPPAGNRFEEHVFKTPSVELYVVIASQHAFASGNWTAYSQQQDFTYEEDRNLSKLVLPPELEGAVYVFRRKARSNGASAPSAT
jgi:hypothetical protein